MSQVSYDQLQSHSGVGVGDVKCGQFITTSTMGHCIYLTRERNIEGKSNTTRISLVLCNTKNCYCFTKVSATLLIDLLLQESFPCLLINL